MILRGRPARPQDFQLLWGLLAKQPAYPHTNWGPLRDEFGAIMRSGGALTLILEDVELRPPTTLAVITAAFISDGSATDLLSLEEPFVRRLVCKQGFLASTTEILSQHRNRGLHLFIFDFAWEQCDTSRTSTILTSAWSQFMGLHCGWHLNSVLTEAHTEQTQKMATDNGYLPVNEFLGWKGCNRGGPFNPRLFCVTRSQANTSHSYTMKQLFRWGAPRCAFDERQRKMLRLAMAGCADQEIAHELGFSKERVKQLWPDIYLLLNEKYPGQLPHETLKRRRALPSFLRDEAASELRPDLG